MESIMMLAAVVATASPPRLLRSHQIVMEEMMVPSEIPASRSTCATSGRPT